MWKHLKGSWILRRYYKKKSFKAQQENEKHTKREKHTSFLNKKLICTNMLLDLTYIFSIVTKFLNNISTNKYVHI